MNTIRPGASYDATNETKFRDEVARAMAKLFVRGFDIETGQGRLIIPSPNGSRWAITVSDAGVVSATLVT